ncbi:MAG: hypothetical protein PHW69_01320 [Elusimicrobiaceae bacterium]|nr:hypothetical protein [Elusimicrobiaceae bacterium]
MTLTLRPLITALLAASLFAAAVPAPAQNFKPVDRQKPQKHRPLPDEDAEPDIDADTADAADTADDIAGNVPDYAPGSDYTAPGATSAGLKIPELATDFKGCGYLFAVEAGDSSWETIARAAINRLSPRVTAETVLRSDNLSAVQAAIDSLQARAVKKIVVIPFFLNSNSDSLNRLKHMLGLRAAAADADKSPGGGVPTSDSQKALLKSQITITSALDDSPAYALAVSRSVRNYRRSRPLALLLVGAGLNNDMANRAKLDIMNRIAAQVTASSACAIAQAFVLRPRGDARRDIGKPELKIDAASFSKSGIYGKDGRLLKETDESSNEQSSAQQLKKTARKLAAHYSIVAVGYSISSHELDKLVQDNMDGLFYSWLGNAALDEAGVQAWLVTKINEGVDLPAIEPQSRQSGGLSSRESYEKAIKDWQ